MTKPSSSWHQYWDGRGKNAGLDYEADRAQSQKSAEAEILAERHLLDFIDAKPGDRIFDGGCGTGINLQRLASKAESLVGMDYSESMVERARRRIESEGLKNVEVGVGSIASTGLPARSFDKVICISVMQYLTDKECQAALTEFSRITKDGGTIILHVKNLASLYLSSLYLAKKVKSLISKNVKIEYYRAQKWYERNLSELGAVPIGFDSRSIFVVDFMPRRLYDWILLMEAKHYKSRFLRRYGSEFFLKARVER